MATDTGKPYMVIESLFWADALHITVLDIYKYLVMIMQEKIKVMKKQIPNSSNSFLFRESYIHSKIPTDYPQNPWRFITVPIPIPYPYPWESPWESPYPRQPWLLCKRGMGSRARSGGGNEAEEFL